VPAAAVVPPVADPAASGFTPARTRVRICSSSRDSAELPLPGDELGGAADGRVQKLRPVGVDAVSGGEGGVGGGGRARRRRPAWQRTGSPFQRDHLTPGGPGRPLEARVHAGQGAERILSQGDARPNREQLGRALVDDERAPRPGQGTSQGQATDSRTGDHDHRPAVPDVPIPLGATMQGGLGESPRAAKELKRRPWGNRQ
jgi:hypothetical protein